ncbi:MAG: serine acetyltransferase [Bacteroidetes bacterium]|nr:serine acetyltransferase [Bacteroidota bacterium]
MVRISTLIYDIKLIIAFFYDLIISIFFFKSLRLILSNHLTIGLSVLKNKRVIFPHPVGIVIGKNVVLGYNCTIYQNVTIGTKEVEKYESAKYPTIGNNVVIFPSSVVFGEITIGDNCIIGAGSLVNKSFPANSVIVGNPAIKIN